jgi:hypothetical protein
MTEWFKEVAAVLQSRRFTPFLEGVEITTSSGHKYLIKIKKTSNSIRPVGFRFSKYSFTTEVTAGDYAGTGYGEADSKLLAFQKSVAEAVERVIFRISKKSGVHTISTNGWAAHISRRHAFSSALEELLERDAVLVHWLAKSPFDEIREETWPAWLKAWTTSELSLAKRFNRLRILKSRLGHMPTITTILMDANGFGVVSHSAGKKMESALCRALAETCRIAQIALQSTNDIAAAGATTEISLIGPEDHAMFYAHKQQLPDWIFGDKSDWRTSANEWSNARAEFNPKSVEPVFHEVTSSPLVIGYVTSPLVQNLYFGTSNEAKQKSLLNLKRLQQVRFGNLNPMPHFIP